MSFFGKILKPNNISYSDTSAWVWCSRETMTQGHWRQWFVLSSLLYVASPKQTSEPNMYIAVQLKSKCNCSNESTKLMVKYIGRQCSLSMKIVLVFLSNFPVGRCCIGARKDERKKVLCIFIFFFNQGCLCTKDNNQNPLLICFCSEKIFLSGSAGNRMYPNTPSFAALPSFFLLASLSVRTSPFVAKPLHTCAHTPCSSFNCSSVSVLWSRRRERSSRSVCKGCVSVTGRCQVPDGQRWDVCVGASTHANRCWCESIETRELSIWREGWLEVTRVGALLLAYFGCSVVRWREKVVGKCVSSQQFNWSCLNKTKQINYQVWWIAEI